MCFTVCYIKWIEDLKSVLKLLTDHWCAVLSDCSPCLFLTWLWWCHSSIYPDWCLLQPVCCKVLGGAGSSTVASPSAYWRGLIPEDWNIQVWEILFCFAIHRWVSKSQVTSKISQFEFKTSQNVFSFTFSKCEQHQKTCAKTVMHLMKPYQWNTWITLTKALI